MKGNERGEKRERGGERAACLGRSLRDGFFALELGLELLRKLTILPEARFAFKKTSPAEHRREQGHEMAGDVRWV